jgi:hypothetical protein
VHDSYSFNFDGPPSGLVNAFRMYYGPTMNAFEAAARQGKEGALLAELEALFESQNQSSHPAATTIPATFLRVTVTVP